MIPKYYDDYAVLLNNMMFGFCSLNYVEYLTDDITVTNSSEVTNGLKYDDLSEVEKNCYSFTSGDIFPQDYNDSFYSSCYEEIYVYNAVANNIMDVPDATQEQKEVIKAEAISRRAFCYFQLVNIYGAAYEASTAATDYGVPLVLSEDINKPYVRNTVQEVYDQIVEDLKYACEKLPAVVNYRTHMCKCGAYALLAKTYLHMGQYDLAKQAAEMSVKSNNNLGMLDYKLYNSDHESVWGRITDADGFEFPYSYECIETLYAVYPTNDFSATIFASKDLMNCYENDLPAGAVDKRREMFYEDDSAIGYSEMTFKGFTMYISYYSASMGPTVQEVYLILAECEARMGSASKATAYLDLIRDNRIVNNQPLVASSNDEALRMTLDERRREFAFRGESRFITLKRLNRDPKVAKTVSHDLDGEKYELTANDVRWVMPLPHNVIDFNPDIPQYDR